MLRSSLMVALVIGSASAAEPPKESSAKAAWLWQQVGYSSEQQAKTKSKEIQAAWLWDESKPCECCVDDHLKSQKDQYGQLRDRAVKEGKSLIVGVGCEPPQVSGYLSVRYDGFPGVKGPKVILGAYRNHDLWQQEWKPPMPSTH